METVTVRVPRGLRDVVNQYNFMLYNTLREELGLPVGGLTVEVENTEDEVITIDGAKPAVCKAAWTNFVRWIPHLGKQEILNRATLA